MHTASSETRGHYPCLYAHCAACCRNTRSAACHTVPLVAIPQQQTHQTACLLPSLQIQGTYSGDIIRIEIGFAESLVNPSSAGRHRQACSSLVTYSTNCTGSAPVTFPVTFTGELLAYSHSGYTRHQTTWSTSGSRSACKPQSTVMV